MFMQMRTLPSILPTEVRPAFRRVDGYAHSLEQVSSALTWRIRFASRSQHVVQIKHRNVGTCAFRKAWLPGASFKTCTWAFSDGVRHHRWSLVCR